MTMSRLLRC